MVHTIVSLESCTCMAQTMVNLESYTCMAQTMVSLESYTCMIRLCQPGIIHLYGPDYGQSGIIHLYDQTMSTWNHSLFIMADYDQPGFVWEGNPGCHA